MADKKSRRRKLNSLQSWWQQIPGWVWMLGGGILLVVIGLRPGMHNGRSINSINPDSAVQVAQGKAIFSQTCAVCHGENGEGNVGPALNGDAHAWHHMDSQLQIIVRDGRPDTAMAGHGDHLTPEEIDAVISYIKSMWTPEQREMQRTGRHPMG